MRHAHDDAARAGISVIVEHSRRHVQRSLVRADATHAAFAGTIHERASPSAPTDDHAAVFFRKRVRIGLSTKSASAAVTMSSVMAALKTGTQLPAC